MKKTLYPKGPIMSKNYEGMLFIPFDITDAINEKHAEQIIHAALDKLGILDLGRFTWDNPEWTYSELDNTKE